MLNNGISEDAVMQMLNVEGFKFVIGTAMYNDDMSTLFSSDEGLMRIKLKAEDVKVIPQIMMRSHWTSPPDQDFAPFLPIFRDTFYSYIGDIDDEPVFTATAFYRFETMCISSVGTVPRQKRKGCASQITKVAIEAIVKLLAV